jgi:DNA-directed RNA polymerase specialized sigma24 family protein
MHFGLRSRIASREPGPEKQAMREELVRRVRREVAGLPVLFRETVRLHRLEELEIDQVAQRVAIQAYAAKSRLVRGQRELRDRLVRAGFTP